MSEDRDKFDTWSSLGNVHVGRQRTANVLVIADVVPAHFVVSGGKVSRGVLPEWARSDAYPDAVVIAVHDQDQTSTDNTAAMAAVLVGRYNLPGATAVKVDSRLNADAMRQLIANKLTAWSAQAQPQVEAINIPTAEQDFETVVSLARKYESSGDPASVSSGEGDLGGVSYGMYQFASNLGVVDAFVDWLCDYDQPDMAAYGHELRNAGKVNSKAFKAKWRELGTVDPGHFGQLQDEYVASKYLDAVTDMLVDVDYNLLRHTTAMQAVAFSRSIQNGPAGATELFELACTRLGYPNLSYVDDAYFDKALITAIYDALIAECDAAEEDEDGVYRSPEGFCNGSEDVIDSLRNRFVREKVDALSLV